MVDKNKRIVMCGCHEGLVPTIESLIQNGVRFDYFVTLTPEQARKHKVSGYYDYRKLAQEYNICHYIPEEFSLDTDTDINFFIENKFDLLIQGGWQRLFPEKILATLKIGAVGVHGSPDFLPKGRGRSPLNWSLIQDKKRFITHAFLIKPGADDGDVFATDSFDITPFDDIKTLYYKSAIVVGRMILENLAVLLSGEIKYSPQQGIPSYFPKRSEKDGLIDWENMDVYQIYNLIRASTRPYPGAFGYIDGGTIRIWRARPFDTRITYPKAPYGKVVEEFNGVKIVNCLGGLLLLEEWEFVESLLYK